MSVSHNNYETVEFLRHIFKTGKELFVKRIFISEIRFIKPKNNIIRCDSIPINFRKKICDNYKYNNYLSTHYFPLLTDREGNAVGIILDVLPDDLLEIALDPSYRGTLFVDARNLSLRGQIRD